MTPLPMRDYHAYLLFQICKKLNVANSKNANKVQAGILKPSIIQSTLAQSPVPLSINLRVSNNGKY
jgi:hypothetical protein